ncbi:TRAP transporter large permease subunit [Chloroflexota bacterium]
MVAMSPELVVLLMFGAVFIGVFLGYPLPFIVGGVAMVIGFMAMGTDVFALLRVRLWGMMISYILLAIPLFIFMGSMVEKSGCAEGLYHGLYLAFGRLRGGLAIATVLMGTVLAACVGIIAASVITLGLIGIPSMLKRGYDRSLISGSVCAGGSLGILIPPSIMLVIYGPMAGISVGKLFMGAFGPGLLLSGLYVTYIAVRAFLQPNIAPPLSIEERSVPFSYKVKTLVFGMLPPLILVLSVLGVIFFGIAAPTEAAACGAFAATILALANKRLTRTVLRETMYQTVKVSTMALMIGWSATMFTGVFLRLKGGTVVADLIMSAPGGKWGAFGLIMFVVFILGFLVDWMAIVFILVPLLAPIMPNLGFDPLWFAIMVCVNLQMAFMTPPMAPAIFFLRGIALEEWGITTAHIVKGIAPFVGFIIVALLLCIAFPDIILWLPHQMIKF